MRSARSGPGGGGHFYHDRVAAVGALTHGEAEASLAVLGPLEEMLLDSRLNRSGREPSFVTPEGHDGVQRERPVILSAKASGVLWVPPEAGDMRRDVLRCP